MTEPDEERDHRRSSRLRTVASVFVLAVLGSVIAVSLFASVQTTLGPFDTTLSVRPISSGGTEVNLAPLGQMRFRSHSGPLGLDWRLDEIREDEARRIAEHPDSILLDEEALTDDVRDGVVSLVKRTVVVAVVGAMALTLLVRPRWRDVLGAGLIGLLLAGAALGNGARTWNADSLAEPRYTGLLSMAPQAVGDARQVVDRFTDYRAQLAALVTNVTVLFQGAQDLRSFQPDDSTIRVLHVSDIHLNPQAFDLIDRLVEQYGVDVVADTGDLNDWGSSVEARFADLIGELDVPYVYVRGNHDSRTTQRAVASQPNAIVLDGGAETVAGLTFWGVGDPRFTPDKSRIGSGDDENQVAEDEAPHVLEAVEEYGPDDIDVVMVHDPRLGNDLGDVVPLVLSGHRHAVSTRTLGEDTLQLVEGSTGGGGLRALEKDEPVPMTASILYFDVETRELQAIDRIQVGGVNQADVRIERTVVIETVDDEDGETDGTG